MAVADSVLLTEIFFSLQGESSRVGLPTVFVRLTGCPLRCGYCDSAYAFYGGEHKTYDEVLQEVAKHGAKYVCVTGGEPLAQKNCLPLLTRLCDEGYSVSLETSGAMSIAEVDPRVSRIMDLKTPGSGEEAKNLLDNLPLLTTKDELKFVLTSEADYEWAKGMLSSHQLDSKCPVLFSPIWEGLKPDQLADWIVRDKLSVRMQVQLHKILWGEKPGV
ncbi:7-carboxy-7-deazaguanine synthase QueE [Leeia sp. TBRC 13508]|uniref:7-carboxy-7-deazaguanine synthase n=1 Tax=Leeia speluncae TaxID=2884804 RepID=A0ABS8D6N3_9NEIS|nr:7-carboxy-7-deazaguanine synthase QueE [Leeia speluncae]MCB6183865.1 7-carboxy-7-deazaguanine synthase QueE [Leeia speluncae]